MSVPLQLVFYFKDDTLNSFDNLFEGCTIAITTRENLYYSHVELRFLNRIDPDDGNPYSFSITGGDPVHMDGKGYNRPDLQYEFLDIPCQSKTENNLFMHCINIRNHRVPFNRFGRAWNFIVPEWLAYDSKGKSAYCSELIARVLQKYNLLSNKHKPHIMSPTDLYLAIREEYSHVPASCKHITKLRNQHSNTSITQPPVFKIDLTR